MNCERAREHFSEWLDGALPAARERELRAHVAACAVCAARWQSYERALGHLRSAPARRTSAHVKGVLLAAVDAAAAQAARAGEEDAALLAAGRHAQGLRRRRLATHAAALLIGAALVLFGLALRGRGAAERSGTDGLLGGLVGEGGAGAPSRGEPVVVERVVERSIEVPRFVPLVREVEVERIVERPVVERVERVVRRGPLVSLDFRALAAAVEDLGAALERAARTRALLAPNVEVEPTDAERGAMLAAGPTARELAPPAPVGSASVRFVRTGEHLKLETFGPVSDVVPVLLSQLESDDREVAALVERRLDAIRGAADADPLAAPRPRPGGAAALRERELLGRLFASSEPASPASPSERWRAWWAENRTLVAEAEQRGSL